ncbi:E1-E2 ATPase-domain-containing protein [Mycena belliarum]|uniref:E1-E2 ATPase-domain-containing protein n=1 Tax=Mycena belliarum TaxID=1033014 RepID=A0AAD6UFU9_9AGAR|nr:E1-E2 ATPase-domain-containing protein [Mycena belliae]
MLPRPSYRFHPSTLENPLGDRSTTVNVSDLHCGSCVITIQSALASLSPPPLSVEVSVVSQTVTVHHLHALSSDAIQAAILDAGFDVPQLRDHGPGPSKRREKHVQQCTLCQNEHATSPTSPPASAPSPSLFRLTLSVGGMTCASCSNSLTRALSDIPGISDVVVSFLGSSAIALIDSKELSNVALEAVEDCGFEGHVMTIEPTASASHLSPEFRTLSLRVDGMFCKHCPVKVMAALEAFGSRVSITTPLTSYTDPVLTVSYKPDPPSFTIRTIIASIEASNSPPFDVAIHRPPSLEERAKKMHEREQRHLLFRTLFTVVVAIPTFIIGILFMSLVKEGNPSKDYLSSPMWVGNTSRSTWALFFLALPVMFYSAGLFHRRSIKEIRALWRKGSKTPIYHRFIRFGSMNLLISAGVTVAFTASVCLLALSASQPPQMKGDTSTYFDSVVFLTMFLLAGRYLEAYSKTRTSDAITSLASLRPVEAQLVVAASNHGSFLEKPPHYDPEKAEGGTNMDTSSGGRILKTTPDFLEVGDIIRCNTGSTPPADGTIVDLSKSTFTFDESMLTGESMPVSKMEGDQVYLGSINRGQSVLIRVDTIGGGTMLDNIVKVVREGSTRRAPIERVADVITSFFVPVITLLAILTWLLWLILAYTGALPPSYLDIEIGGWTVWSLRFAIAVFVVACPCGIALAAPTALLVGSGLAAKHGILARGGGEAFQEMERVNIVVFDKTGTLTEGEQPRVSDCEFTPDFHLSKEVLLGIAAELESATSHPLAIAVRHYCAANGAHHQNGSSFVETAGLGVEARFNAGTAIIGSQAFMEKHNITIDDSTSRTIQTWKTEAKSVVFLAVSDGMGSEQFGTIAAVFAVTDPIRPEAESVVSWFAKRGVSTWMISGDNIITASAVAKMVGIPLSNVIAGVLPHEKGEKIQMLQTGAHKTPNGFWQSINGQPKIARNIVAMVGDGINDAVALTVADIGVAIGSGSDVAISSASFILLSSDLRALITLCDLSRSIMKRVRVNFVWAILYNLAALPIAAGVVYPAGHVRLDPVWASLAMALSSVSVVCSSLALKLYQPPKLLDSAVSRV